MLSSPIHKFQSIITHNSNHHLKQRKRRKKRKKSQIIINMEIDSLSARNSTTKALTRNALKKNQYYQHDNRSRLKAKSSRVPSASSIMFPTFNENSIDRELHYNEVAKKFKPIHKIKKNKNSINSKKAFFKYDKVAQKRKENQKIASMGKERDCENKFKRYPTSTLALMRPQICLCSCRNEHQRYDMSSYAKNNDVGLQTDVVTNIHNRLSSHISNASHSATASLVKCSKKLATINNDFTKILENLHIQTPTLLFDNFFDGAKLFENVEKSSRIGDTYYLAKAQQDESTKLRKALNISKYSVESSAVDLDHKAKKDIAKSLTPHKELETKSEEKAAAAASKEIANRYALVRTPSIEHNFSGDTGAVAVDKTYSTLKKKKRKKIRERSPSPERKKDKKKKSKKSKKESKPKRSKKERKHKCSESETNVGNDKESVDEDTGSDDIGVEVKKSRKKQKKDKKKRKNKRNELTSSDEAMPPSNKTAKNAYYSSRSRSQSKAKSIKPSESQRHRNDSACSHTNRIYSRNNKTYSSKCDDTTKAQNLKYLDRERNRYSHDRNTIPYNRKDCVYRRSRSIIKSEYETAEENVKKLKRKYVDTNLQRKEYQSPIMDKRKRYSQSHSSTTPRKSCEKISLAINVSTEKSPYKRHSRTPIPRDSDNRSNLSKSRSRSSSFKTIFRNKSLSSTPQTSKIIEPVKSKKLNKYQKKREINRNNKDKSDIPKRAKSRSISVSSHRTASTDTRISQSKTPSPKADEPCISKQQKKTNFSSPISTPTPKHERSKYVNEERKTRDKKHLSPSKEWVKSTKEKIDKKSRTPPPKIDKKTLSPKSSRDSSELSYSPAGRNPERYRDILENNKQDKCKIDETVEDKRDINWDRKEKGGKNERNHAKPVVRLQSQSDDESEATERTTEKILDEFQELKRNKDINDLKILEHLKTGLAAKAKEKIKTIEKMAASTSTKLSSNNDKEMCGKSFKRTVRNSLNEFLTANNVAPAVVASCSTTTFKSMPSSPPGAIYPQTFEEIKKEQESVLQLTENISSIENNRDIEKGNEKNTDCNNSLISANDHALNLFPTGSSVQNSLSTNNKEKDRKRERDTHERERENYGFYKDRYLERRQKSIASFYNTSGSGIGGGTVGGGRRNSNNSMININHRQRINIVCNSGGGGGHNYPHSHLYPHHHHPNHKIINNHHNSSTSSFFLANNTASNPHNLLCNHSNTSTNISYNRPSRINNTPLITATQFNNQMLSKQSNSILVNRRDHRTALSLGLSGTPCTNFSNSNLLLTKANANSHHLHVAPVGHVIGGHHHQHHHHHHHHHGQNAGASSGSGNSTQITDRILMAASLVAAQRQSLGVHATVSSAAAIAAANNLNFLHQQNKPKLVIKPFKINDSQPLVAALADSSLVDAIVSKVSTATVAAAESAARRSRSRSRRSRSRKRHGEKSSVASNSGGGENEGIRRRSLSRSRSSRSSSSSRSRGRSHSDRSSHSRTSQSSSSSRTSSRSSSSSSFGTSRSGTRSPSIPRRRGSPSFLDRRRITSARKRPIPYHRKLSSDASSCYCSSCCSRESSPHTRSPSQDSRSPLRFLET